MIIGPLVTKIFFQMDFLPCSEDFLEYSHPLSLLICPFLIKTNVVLFLLS